MEEIWVPMEGNPKYEVSSYGFVRSVRFKKPLKRNPNGYMVIRKPDSNEQVTRRMEDIMLETFSGLTPGDYVVDFRDGDRLNCRLDNLTIKEVPNKHTCYSCGVLVRGVGRNRRLCQSCFEARQLETLPDHCYCGSFVPNGWDGVCYHEKSSKFRGGWSNI